MKKYLWLILLIVVILGATGYYLYIKNVHDYGSCVRAGGQVSNDRISGICKYKGERYFTEGI